MIEIILYLLLLIGGIPVGLLLVRLCKDEVKNWISRFWSMILICVILIVSLWFGNFVYQIPTIVGLLFVVIVDLVIIFRAK